MKMKEYKIEGAEINTALRLARQLRLYLDMVVQDMSVTDGDRELWEDALQSVSNGMYKLCEIAGSKLYDKLCEHTEVED